MTENFYASLDEAQGQFWIPGSSELHGYLKVSDAFLCVELDGILRPWKSKHLTITSESISTEISGSPKDAVLDYIPVPIFGRLTDGRLLTLLDARADISSLFESVKQRFCVTRVLDGAHAIPDKTSFKAARITIPYAECWEGLYAVGDQVRLSMSGFTGILEAFIERGFGWLQMSIVEGDGLVIQELDRRYWNRFYTLLRLWTNAEIAQPERVQLRTDVENAWSELIRFPLSKQERGLPYQSLLEPEGLTLTSAAGALSTFEKLAPIPDIAIRDAVYNMTLESALLANASSLEGLHSRCYEKSKPFPGISKRHNRGIVNKAVQAAAEEAVRLDAVSVAEQEYLNKRLWSSFQSFNRQTFKERLDELLSVVEPVAPGLIGIDRSAWVGWVVLMRNLQAHKLTEKMPNYQARNDMYYQLAISTGWVLRICLLLQIGVSVTHLHLRLKEHEKFLYALANMDSSTFSWPGSRFDEFINSEAPSAETC